MKNHKLFILALCLVLSCLVALPVRAIAQDQNDKDQHDNNQRDKDRRDQPSTRSQERIEKEVRHELLMLPYFGVFDNIAYRVEGYNVILVGQVTRPTLKSDSENVVKRIEGVEHVDNQIEVLPVSPMDDQLRRRLFRAIYGYPALEKYALGVQKPIRIIVKNGRVNLEGVVDSEADKNLAGLRANGVSGTFQVTNNLQVVKN